MICTILIQVLFGLYPVSHAAHAQSSGAVLVRVEDRTRVGVRNRVVLRTTADQADRDIYRSEGGISGEVVVSPEGLYLSFFEVLEGQTGRSLQHLVILDLAGQVVRRVAIEGDRGIRRYVWCCGPNKIAILRGSSREDPTFRPETVFVVDVRTGNEEHLPGILRPDELHWASFDRSLYVKAFPPRGSRGSDAVPPVYRYDARRRVVSLTSHRNVFFSPDGLYYFDPSREGSAFRLYRSSDDQDVTARLQLPAERVRWGPEFGWMPGEGHVLLFVDRPPQRERKPGQPRLPPRLMDRNAPQVYPDRWNLAVDAETGDVRHRFQGDLGAGWKTNIAALPIERRTGIEIVQLQQQ